jgi:hypothetical protein
MIKTCACGQKSITGLKAKVSLCKYHLARQLHGKAYANAVFGKGSALPMMGGR